MKKLCTGFTVVLLTLLLWSETKAQTVGIGTDFPTASLHVRSTTAIPGIRVERALTPSNAAEMAIVVNDNSNIGASNISYTGPGVLPSAAATYIQNESTGTSAIWAVNINNVLNTAPVALFTQNNIGDGVIINLIGSSGDGIEVLPGSNLNNMLYADHFGFNSWGVWNNNMQSGVGLYNDMDAATGVAIINYHTVGPVDPSVLIDISYLGGYNYGIELNAENASTSGFYAYNMDIASGTGSATNGDGWLHDAFVYTATAPIITPGGTLYNGGAFGADQYGNGPGIYINQHGSTSENAVFITSNAANLYPTLSIQDAGEGGAIDAQNSSTAPFAPVTVGSFIYTGGDASFDHVAVLGISNTTDGSFGYGYGTIGVGGWVGAYGQMADANGLAGVYSADDLGANGAKMFIIDHPLDPENKLLRHFSLESNEVLNVYQGTAVIEQNGKATVPLPDYFEAINVHYNYQLTAIGTPRQPYIHKEIQNNRFIIGGKPNSKVSWVVIANRNDAYVRNNPGRLEPEVEKRPDLAGRYLNPASHGKPESMGIFYREPPNSTKIAGRTSAGNLNTEKAQPDKTPRPTVQERQEQISPVEYRNMTRRSVGPAPEPAEKMQIRHEIKTWDEIH